jgi:hypothetical protein
MRFWGGEQMRATTVYSAAAWLVIAYRWNIRRVLRRR